jgi:ABC-type xylose transport system substrate-binding protein
MKFTKIIIGICITAFIISLFTFSVVAQSKGLIVYSVCWTEDPFWVASTDAVDSRGIVSAVKELQDAGIPIGVIIRNIPNAGKIDVTVDANMFGIGEKSAINTLNLLFSKYGAYEGTVLEIEGALTDNASVDFHGGFMSIMEKYPDVTIEP